MTFKELAEKSIDEYVSYKGIEHIRGQISRQIYEDYISLIPEKGYVYLGYITFRSIIMPKYHLNSIQIRIPDKKRIRIFI